jgi:hypothetical protein
MIGSRRTAPDRTALVNGCLVRHVDFMDNIASKGKVRQVHHGTSIPGLAIYLTDLADFDRDVSGVRTKSIHPVSIALIGISGALAVSGL